MFVQAAPAGPNIEYECPKCKWRYMTLDDEVLVLWHPGTVGVTTQAWPPGTQPAEVALEGASSDTDQTAAEKVRGIKEWREREANNEPWGSKPQVLTPKGNGEDS